jgi:hypothetical protein
MGEHQEAERTERSEPSGSSEVQRGQRESDLSPPGDRGPQGHQEPERSGERPEPEPRGFPRDQEEYNDMVHRRDGDFGPLGMSPDEIDRHPDFEIPQPEPHQDPQVPQRDEPSG